MPSIVQSTTLDAVEHILVSGTGVLDFAVAGENGYYTWRGVEDADWSVEDVERVGNADEDRVVLYPEGDAFICEIEATGEEHNEGPVRCYCS
jgi:hypothetical protein